MKNIGRQLDALLAVAIFILSSAAATYGYSQAFPNSSIANSALSSTALLTEISLGKQSYAITQHGNCVGTIQTSLSEGKLFELSSVVSIFVADSSTTPNLVIQAFFNPLGQLIRSSLKLNLDPLVALEIQTRDVTPITLSLTSNLSGHQQEKSYVLPGPVLLRRKNDSSNFQIEYFQLQKLSFPRLAAALTPLQSRANISVSTSADQCGKLPKTTLDLQFFGKEITPLLQKIMQGALDNASQQNSDDRN